jgi:tRNA A37 N6-isopentenylltransferase MiaA
LESLGLEYRWLTRYLQNKLTLAGAKLKLKGDIHGFIRRQKTYFKQFKDINLFDISQKNWHHKLEKTLKDWYNQKHG